MKKRDDAVREGGAKATETVAPASPKKGSTSPTHSDKKKGGASPKRVKIQANTSVVTSDNSDVEDDKPPTPMTLRAQQFFDSLDAGKRYKKAQSFDPGNSITMGYGLSNFSASPFNTTGHGENSEMSKKKKSSTKEHRDFNAVRNYGFPGQE